TVEIKSLNHRYFEFSLRLPPPLSSLENRIRDLVQSRIGRGKVMVAVSHDVQNGTEKAISLDESALRFYTSAVQKLKKKYRLQGELTVSDLLKLPGIFTVEQAGEDPERVWAGLKKILEQAVAGAVRSKESEGKRLAADVEKRLTKIEASVRKIETLALGRAEHIYRKLSERIDALLARKEADTERVHREAAFLAERSDITEEMVRLRSHLKVFKQRLAGARDVGRELDFLCQEMNREINTVASKAQMFDISSEVIFVKGEIEKIREQIQNIE
ncbi:MAG: YicC family protein, partial [candidate division Zixibacteria bacterium]|nr:YicC family protein [candidate division Zixibacteria bacterium]